MKLVILNGSYRQRGNTANTLALLEEHLQALAQAHGVPVETETVHLGHIDLQACRGCRICFNAGEALCPQKDDVLALKARILAADGIVLASPVYVDDVSGIMKTWIDRMAHVCHRPEFAGKVALLVATSGNTPCKRTLHTMATACRTWGFHLAGQIGLVTGAHMRQRAIAQRFTTPIERAAAQLFQAIHRRTYARPSFVALMVFKIQQRYWQRETEPSHDLDHWVGHGWTQPEQSYFFPHQAHPLKVAAARFVGSIVALFVT